MPDENDPCQAILDYLDRQMPGYPFEPQLDRLFVQEMDRDFPDVDILEQLKAFRWYYDNDPAGKHSNLRLAVRRWVGKAYTRNHYA